MATGKESEYTAPALYRGLKILELFGPQQPIYSTAELADAIGVSKASIYRLLQTLTETGHLEKLDRDRYGLGAAMVANGFAYLATREVVDVAAAPLRKLRDQTSLSAHLALRDGQHAIYIYRAIASQRLSVNVPVGTRLPCHVCAIGRALLFDASADELAQIYGGAQLDGYAVSGPATLPELNSLLADERKSGISTNHSDYATAMAVPVKNYANEVVAAINLSGADVYMKSADVAQHLRAALLDCAATISTELGYGIAADVA